MTNASSSTIPMRAYTVLAIGVLSVSMAAIFIRLALDEGIPPLVVAAARLTIAALVLTLPTLTRYRAAIARLSRQEQVLIGVSGAFLALHFATWVSSLQYTSVLISGVLVTTTPIWSGMLEVVVLKSRLTWALVAGLAIALLGGAIIAASGGTAAVNEGEALLGAGLSTVGAMSAAVYLIIGRKVRAKLPLLPYIWLVYGCAALILLLFVTLTAQPVVGFSPEGYLWLLALGLIPQLIGHSSLNYALAYLPATYVSLATQLEPLGSATAAYFIFLEQPTVLQVVGSLVILVGVTLATAGPLWRKRTVEPVLQ